VPGSTSFALLPDDEGAAAAVRLLQRKQDQVLVLRNGSDSAQRSVAAFRETLRRGGGAIVAEIPVAGDSDLSTQLAALAAAPKPPTAVYLALEAGPAHAVAAQLKASALAGLPRIASSQILSGGNARGDVELDGVEYPELPWLLDQAGGLPAAASLRALPSARGPSQRLFAFGADAWKLAAYFERLYNDPAAAVPGATGALSIDVAGPVRRAPAWAIFSGGHSRPSR
jgi:outer membrane PBP1 activator LpoA protein